jgi:hypothetical protein
MLADEWERVKLLFEAALDVPAEQRQQHLDAVCAGDEDLKRPHPEPPGNHPLQ